LKYFGYSGVVVTNVSAFVIYGPTGSTLVFGFFIEFMSNTHVIV
jgi:hypothetical protein